VLGPFTAVRITASALRANTSVPATAAPIDTAVDEPGIDADTGGYASPVRAGGRRNPQCERHGAWPPLN
jgi:hypothetical protein